MNCNRITGTFSAAVFVLSLGAGARAGETPTHQLAVGIAKQGFIELGGELQYVEVMGASRENPVLLFIHGGPGWPQTPQLRYFSSEVANDVTLVVWEQRGSGKSFMRNPDPENVTLAQIVSDGHELTQKLKEKFGREKIHLAGYSWGSLVGMRLVQAYPQDYALYIGIGQSVNVERGMAISQAWLRERATEAGDEATLAELDALAHPKADFCSGTMACFIKQYALVSKYGGAVHRAGAEAEIEASMTAYADYRDYDWMAAFNFSSAHLEDDLLAADMRGIERVEVPVVLFLGRHDWNVPAVQAAEFLENLQAPAKAIVWFEDSAHEMLEEEAGKFNRELVRVVKRGLN